MVEDGLPGYVRPVRNIVDRGSSDSSLLKELTCRQKQGLVKSLPFPLSPTDLDDIVHA